MTTVPPPHRALKRCRYGGLIWMRDPSRNRPPTLEAHLWRKTPEGICLIWSVDEGWEQSETRIRRGLKMAFSATSWVFRAAPQPYEIYQAIAQLHHDRMVMIAIQEAFDD